MLHHTLTYYAHTHPDWTFADFENEHLSYGDAEALSDQLANAILDQGLKPGERVAYLAKNCLPSLIALYAASKAGVVLVPLNYRLAPAEWQYIIDDADAVMVIAAEEYLQAIDSVRNELPSVKHFVCLEKGSDNWLDYNSWLERQKPNIRLWGTDTETVLYQMYTSGTTGHPKGVLINQRNLMANIQQWIVSMPLRFEPQEQVLCVLPVYHAAGMMQCLAAVYLGNHLILHREVNPVQIIDDLSSKDISWAALVPAVILACLNMVPGIREKTFPSLKQMIYGAAPISASVLEQAIEVFDCDFVQAFGQTEATAVLTVMDADDHKLATEKPELLRSAGRALPGTHLRVVDSDGQSLPIGKVGELVATGPQIMQGYWNLPEATARALKDGWLYTGDAAYMDEQGYVYIQDRIKDMIISGAENIYPAEVENAIQKHPEIADVAVIGVPDPEYGEAVLAIVVCAPGFDISLEQVQQHCRPLLAGYKIPRKLNLIAELPRNASGKILKRELRKPYWKDQNRQIS